MNSLINMEKNTWKKYKYNKIDKYLWLNNMY